MIKPVQFSNTSMSGKKLPDKDFYDAHPDLAPRGNLLLYYGKVITGCEIDSKYKNMLKVSPWKKFKFWAVNKAIDLMDRLSKK